MEDNRILTGILAHAERSLAARGFNAQAPFPARLVRDLLPTDGRKRMCLEAIYRAIGRGHLEAVRIGREWFCDLLSLARWIDRRSRSKSVEVPATPPPDVDAMHAAVEARLKRRSRRRT